MNPNALLSLISHATNGDDALAPGVHLRWQFARELGFPSGGFKLYRRDSAFLPPTRCDSWEGFAGNQLSRAAELGVEPALKISSSRYPLELQATPGNHPPQDARGLALGGAVTITLELRRTASQALIYFAGSKGSRINVSAFMGSELVAAEIFELPDGGLHPVGVRAGSFDRLTVNVRSANLDLPAYALMTRVCTRFSECESTGWTLLSRAAGTAAGLTETMAVLSDTAHLLPQGFREVPGVVSSEDCASTPAAQLPKISLPALDAVLMASLDPTAARKADLAWVDETAAAGRTYDYRVIGVWPDDQPWSLARRLSFDDLTVGRVFDENLFQLGGVWLKTAFHPEVVESTGASGTAKALRCSPDRAGWNAPSGLAGAIPNGIVELAFSSPIGEFQAFVSRDGAPLSAEAWSETEKVADAVLTTGEGMVCLQPVDPDKRIRRVVLKAASFRLHWAAWHSDRIPHGTHCSTIFNVAIQERSRLEAPIGVAATALPGLMKQAAGCSPLMEGDAVDARSAAGVRWALPTLPSPEPARLPVRYHIEREGPDGERTLITQTGPILPLPPTAATNLRLPREWRAHTPLFIDWGLEAGRTYRYRIAGIDIFGRQSPWSEASQDVIPQAPPPATPAFVRARFLDRRDPLAPAEALARLPTGIIEGLLIEWNWPADLDRLSWSVDGFQLKYQPGRPNCAEVAVIQVGTPNAAAWPVTLESSGLAALPADALAGRLLVQGPAAFRIISHAAGSATAGGLRASAVLALPPAGSRSEPVVGPGSISFAAEIPVECAIRAGQTGANVALLTKHLSAGHANLLGAKVVIAGLDLPIAEVASERQAGGALAALVRLDPMALLQQGLETVDATELSALISPTGAPFSTRLKLPPPPLQECKDFAAHESWSVALADAAYEGPNAYSAVVSSLPADLAGAGAPRRFGAISVCSFRGAGTSRLRSPMAAPASIEKISRVPPAAPAAFPAVSGNDGDLQPLLASAPNFAGKSSVVVSWPGSEHFYEVYRALDQTIFKICGVDPAVIESATRKNAALVELASRAQAVKAFSRLDVPPAKLARSSNGYTFFTDDSLDGRAKGRYLYRVKAVDAVGNKSPLSPASVPIVVAGVPTAEAPAVTQLQVGDGSITLQWRSAREVDLIEYLVYRADTLEAARDIRLMTKIGAVPKPPGTPAAVSWTDSTVVGGLRYFYRLAAKTTKAVSSPGPVIETLAVDPRPPRPPVWIQAAWETSGVALSWRCDLPQAMYQLSRRVGPNGAWTPIEAGAAEATVDAQAQPGATNSYRVRVIGPSGTASAYRVISVGRRS